MKVQDDFELVCKEVVELITEYLGDSMPPESRVRLEDHLRDCAPCRAHLAEVRATLQLTRGLGRGAQHDASIADDLMHLFRRWKSERPGS
jgi:anti-sigma factor RsiW